MDWVRVTGIEIVIFSGQQLSTSQGRLDVSHTINAWYSKIECKKGYDNVT